MADLTQQIQAYLKQKGSPLAAFAGDFVRTGQKYGLDPRFLVAISGAETSFGKAGSKLANPFGYNSARRYSGPREVLDLLGRDLARTGSGALYQGKNSIGAIGATWAPAGAANDAGGNSRWPSVVGQFYAEQGGNRGGSVRTRGGGATAATTTQPQVPVTPTGTSPGVTGEAQLSALMGNNPAARLQAQQMAGQVQQLDPKAAAAIMGYAKQGRSSVSAGTYTRNSSQFQLVKAALLKNLADGQAAGRSALQAVGGAAAPTDLSLGLGAARGGAGAVAAAERYKGTPYSWGGGNSQGPSRGFGRGATTTGFDCSSLVQYAWAQQGVKLPRVTYDQMKVGRPVGNVSQARSGDLLFPNPGHVQMYIGNGMAIESPQTGGVVQVVPVRSSYVSIRRPN